MTTQASAGAYAARLEETLPMVRDRMKRAASAAGRSEDSVRLVAVTKGHPVEAIDAALGAGLHDLGENRVHELDEKATGHSGPDVTWHMIGHIQGRKARRVAELADLIHSIDSTKLAERLSRIAVEDGIEVAGLAQVNTSGEGSKSGFDPVEAVEQIHRIAELPGLRIQGLMTMAPYVDNDAVIVDAFAGLRDTLDRLHAITEVVGPELSMGMTNDMDIAIREGSTIVRIGTALFGERVGA
ncbi:MAG: YggS family pyridoxal phosphate-dependent enzyme [Gemmatimonadota bacterium]|nr:YggS family pyridoxal phosphate-dependent enzyme [Gemmatimonadota bacterium]